MIDQLPRTTDVLNDGATIKNLREIIGRHTALSVAQWRQIGEFEKSLWNLRNDNAALIAENAALRQQINDARLKLDGGNDCFDSLDDAVTASIEQRNALRQRVETAEDKYLRYERVLNTIAPGWYSVFAAFEKADAARTAEERKADTPTAEKDHD